MADGRTSIGRRAVRWLFAHWEGRGVDRTCIGRRAVRWSAPWLLMGAALRILANWFSRPGQIAKRFNRPGYMTYRIYY